MMHACQNFHALSMSWKHLTEGITTPRPPSIFYQIACFKMSDVKDITPDLKKLESQLDNLEDELEPLLENLEGMSSQLPLLDKAKLFSLTAYAIESMLFCESTALM